MTFSQLNYEAEPEDENVTVGEEKVAFDTKKAAFAYTLFHAKVSKPTKEKATILFDRFGYEQAFSRADLMQMFNMASSSAGKVLNKLKKIGLIESVAGQGKGKHKFFTQQ